MNTTEKEFVPVADKLFKGDRVGAVEELAKLLVGILTGHPVLGAVGGTAAKLLATGLANGFVDAATQRMLEADKRFDDVNAQSAWLRAQMVASVQPLLADQDDRDDERFLQTIRYIERTVASASAMEDVLRELRALGQHVRATVDRPSIPTTRVEPQVTGSAQSLRSRMASMLSPEELEVLVTDLLPESGGLHRIVSGLHPHEYQVFKVIDYCRRRGTLDRLHDWLAAKMESQ